MIDDNNDNDDNYDDDDDDNDDDDDYDDDDDDDDDYNYHKHAVKFYIIMGKIMEDKRHPNSSCHGSEPGAGK
ncbi:hypothetical protein ACOMHN_019057 [Nucella lapillus]